MGPSHFYIPCKQCVDCPLFWNIFSKKFIYKKIALEDRDNFSTWRKDKFAPLKMNTVSSSRANSRLAY
jgi:hypothetical protein